MNARRSFCAHERRSPSVKVAILGAMFESAELGHAIDDATFKKRAATLRADLLDAQYDLIEKHAFPVIILINGVDGAGKGETVNVLNEWMDTRHIQNHAFGPPTEEESARPLMWRYWRALPPKGKIGVLFGNWYTQPIVGRTTARISSEALDVEIGRINRFERMLCDEGALVLKFWFHLSKDAQKKRLKALAKSKATRWRVTKTDWKNFARYDRFAKVSERVLRQTSTGDAPWIVLEGADANYRTLTVATQILKSLKERLGASAPRGKAQPHAANVPPLLPSVDGVRILQTLDYQGARLGKARFEQGLPKVLGRLNALSRQLRDRSVVLVFEGNDAAGKGGTIRRITSALDARQYSVIQVAAPTQEERAQPYLWRFWRHLPGRGRFTIYDRSWYGRVLVERVEGFCSQDAWTRAYSEINDFELQLSTHGVVVVKFWLAVTKDEQLRRFKERETTRFKRFKITDEDWRNRDKWEAYEIAACDMIDRTSTSYAPWTLVEANDKHYARQKALETLCARLEEALG